MGSIRRSPGRLPPFSRKTSVVNGSFCSQVSRTLVPHEAHSKPHSPIRGDPVRSKKFLLPHEEQVSPNSRFVLSLPFHSHIPGVAGCHSPDQCTNITSSCRHWHLPFFFGFGQ